MVLDAKRTLIGGLDGYWWFFVLLVVFALDLVNTQFLCGLALVSLAGDGVFSEHKWQKRSAILAAIFGAILIFTFDGETWINTYDPGLKSIWILLVELCVVSVCIVVCFMALRNSIIKLRDKLTSLRKSS